MDKLSPPIAVTVTFEAADGSTVPAPEGFAFASSTTGVDALTFNPEANADGSYTLTVAPTGVGSDTVSVAGLTGDLSVSVTAPAAVSVKFNPSSI